jgi:hypothetical protein
LTLGPKLPIIYLFQAEERRKEEETPMKQRKNKFLKAITVATLLLLAVLSACSQNSGNITEPMEAGPTWTPKPYIAGTPDATLPSFGWSGGAGGASLAAPERCGAEATSTTEIIISWTIPSDLANHSGFRIYQGVESLEEEIVDVEATSIVIDNLDPGVQYHFDVRSFDPSAESEADACAIDVTTLQ